MTPADYNTWARNAFALANGWRYSVSRFSPDTLARAGVHSADERYIGNGDHPCQCFDHGEYYRQNRRAVAIIGHQYDEGRAIFEWLRSRSDLVARVPQAGAAASWYLPGGALPVAVVRPGTEIVWPTGEQIENTSRVFAEMKANFEPNKVIAALFPQH